MKKYDLIVIGSGPAGQKAAVQAAKAGKRVALIESDRHLGGACVHRGTIPSKTLRENAMRVVNMRSHAQLFSFSVRPDLEMAALIDSVSDVLSAHDHYIGAQLVRNDIDRIHGRASYIDNHKMKIAQPGGVEEEIYGEYSIICCGSVPRDVPHIPVDHEHIFDSDSILSMIYLPQSLTVLGGGVIASEYATVFASLGVDVTMIDRYEKPLGFLDAALVDLFVEALNDNGVKFIGGETVQSVKWDGVSQVITETEDGQVFHTEKLLLAAGRVANVTGLCIENAGLHLNEQGVLTVDEHCRTEVPNIFAAGDVIGPPSLASASMEQGRRAACAALDIDLGKFSDLIPAGIYAIPELSTVGLSEAQAREKYGEPIIGVARFEEIARGHISEIQEGQLRLIADPQGEKVLGVQIIGEGATELIHIGQMALVFAPEIDNFVENTFNFPTMAEAYRVAALNVLGQRP